MAITGEKNTVKLDDLDRMIDFLQPTWIIPMHYAIPPLGGADAGGMTPVDAFVNRRSLASLSQDITRFTFRCPDLRLDARPSSYWNLRATSHRAGY